MHSESKNFPVFFEYTPSLYGMSWQIFYFTPDYVRQWPVVSGLNHCHDLRPHTVSYFICWLETTTQHTFHLHRGNLALCWWILDLYTSKKKAAIIVMVYTSIIRTPYNGVFLRNFTAYMVSQIDWIRANGNPMELYQNIQITSLLKSYPPTHLIKLLFPIR